MPRADQRTFSLPGPAAQQADPEAIARRAYQLYQERGGEPGHEIEDWLQAETELTSRGEATPVADIGDSLQGRADGRPTSSSTAPLGSSGAPARRGNGSRRAQRQPQSH